MPKIRRIRYVEECRHIRLLFTFKRNQFR